MTPYTRRTAYALFAGSLMMMGCQPNNLGGSATTTTSTTVAAAPAAPLALDQSALACEGYQTAVARLGSMASALSNLTAEALLAARTNHSSDLDPRNLGKTIGMLQPAQDGNPQLAAPIASMGPVLQQLSAALSTPVPAEGANNNEGNGDGSDVANSGANAVVQSLRAGGQTMASAVVVLNASVATECPVGGVPTTTTTVDPTATTVDPTATTVDPTATTVDPATTTTVAPTATTVDPTTTTTVAPTATTVDPTTTTTVDPATTTTTVDPTTTTTTP